MEERRGNGIFLGIVSVATLVVAIIGATFAYFSASTESEEGAVGAGAYEYKLTLSVIPIYPTGATALIPLEASKVIENGPEGNNTYLEYALNVAKEKCVDDQGLQVCALYQVMIENQAANGVTLSGQLRTVTNEPGSAEGATGFTNLTYQALTGNHEDNTLELEGSPATVGLATDDVIDIADIVIPGATIDPDTGDVTANGVGTSYVLVYLNENGDQSLEMGSKFTGQLIYSSSDAGGNVLTGRFTVEGPAEEEEGA